MAEHVVVSEGGPSGAEAGPVELPGSRGWLQALAARAWAGVTAAIAAISGLAPHVLHHVGPIAGAAILTGVGGAALFGALGFVLSVPFLVRLKRRFRTWRAPAIALAVFAAVFTLSTLVIGPAISRDGGSATPVERGATTPSGAHEQHHR